jgi:hypothetical protein
LQTRLKIKNLDLVQHSSSLVNLLPCSIISALENLNESKYMNLLIDERKTELNRTNPVQTDLRMREYFKDISQNEFGKN